MNSSKKAPSSLFLSLKLASVSAESVEELDELKLIFWGLRPCPCRCGDVSAAAAVVVPFSSPEVNPVKDEACLGGIAGGMRRGGRRGGGYVSNGVWNREAKHAIR